MLKKRGGVRNNDFSKGIVSENSAKTPEERQREMEILQQNLSSDPHAIKMAEKQKRAAERKAARARGERKYTEYLQTFSRHD